MFDPGSIATGIGLGKNILQFADWLKAKTSSPVISAYFDAHGNRIEGSDKIEVDKHSTQSPAEWWFSVKPFEDYVFVRFPVIESGIYEVIGKEQGKENPDSRYWRYLAEPLRGKIYGAAAEPNAEVQFIVIGYRPKAIVKHFSK